MQLFFTWTTTLNFKSLSLGTLEIVAKPDLNPQNLPPGPSGLKKLVS